ncbi:hypothetical protein EV359DRAFT_87701 [Lentinula novae-zelandiae]|nr:hypothetical protein EV359DRAFT_87701 [Lentinula novae-zelandiae]
MNQIQPHPLWPQVQDPPTPPLIGAQNAALYLPNRFLNVQGMDPPTLAYTQFPFSAALNLVPNMPLHAFQALPGALPLNLLYNNLRITQRFPLPVTLSNIAANVNHTHLDRLNNACSIPLHQSSFLHTSESRTKTPTAVQNMHPVLNIHHPPQFPRLRKLYRSDTLWGRLKSYGYMDGPLGPRCTTRPPPVHGALPVLPLPSREQQINAIHGLWAWHQERCTRPTFIEVESEPAVQDEVKKQLLNPLELLLHTRYPKQLRRFLHNQTPQYWQMINNNHLPSDGILQELQFDVEGHGTWLSYPRWGRSTSKSNLGSGQHGKHTAGFSDYALYVRGYKQCIAALYEVKTFWAYDSTRMYNLSAPSDGTLNNTYRERIFEELPGDTNVINWHSTSIVVSVLKQIWGQMVYNNADYATWTNGKHVIIFLRTGLDELTVSTHDRDNHHVRRSHRWEDPDVLAALFGMCCAAIDSKFLGDQNLMQYLVGHRY